MSGRLEATVGAAAGARDGRKKGAPGSAVAQVTLSSTPETPCRLVTASAGPMWLQVIWSLQSSPGLGKTRSRTARGVVYLGK